MEIILSSNATSELWNTCIWDLQTGAVLQTYKGGSSASRTLCHINKDYIISSVCNKSALHVWSLVKQDQISMKMVTSGSVRAMSVSPCGQFCVAAILEKLCLWQISTGELLAATVGHYQNINVIHFTADGSYIVSGGDDGQVLVWSLPRLITGDHQKGIIYSWNHHSLPVTDLHIGCASSRITSSSLDHTCKMYDLISGSLICTFVFPTCVTSVCLDSIELRLFAGLSNGDIKTINLFSQPLVKDILSDDSNDKMLFKEHKKQVTCLSVSMTGTLLVSGSHDWTAKVWDIASGQCLRTLHHKGAVTNCFIMMSPPGLLEHGVSKPSHPIQVYKRFVTDIAFGKQISTKPEPVRVLISERDDVCEDNIKESSSYTNATYTQVLNNRLSTFTEPRSSSLVDKDQWNKLYEANKQLYKMAVEHFLTEAHH